MKNINIKLGDSRRELTYDLYPSVGRVKMYRKSVHDRQSISALSYDNNQHGDDRRELTYDFYPGDRRRA